MNVESGVEVDSSLTQRKKRSMRRAARIQHEQYTILRSRLSYKSLSACRSCHAPIHRQEATCPWCGADRKSPVTGATQRLPKLPAPNPWYRSYARLLLGFLLTLLQAKLWLWLWPMPHVLAGASRAGEPHLDLFYYAVVIALGATLCLHYRLTRRALFALIGLLFCWLLRALMV
jgi:hypothetical protein